MRKNGFGRMSRISKKLFLPEFFITLIIGLATGNTTVIYILTIIMGLTIMSPMFVDTYESINPEIFEGSIIRDYDEILKEKSKYISLLELLEKYKAKTDKKDLDTETPSIDSDESIDQVQNKAR